MTRFRPARCCTKCGFRLPGKLGHGWPSESGGIVHGRCPKPLPSLSADQIRALAPPEAA